MIRTTVMALLVGVTVLTAQDPRLSGREMDNVAAFARLYGVVRYFYPSDAAADLDWNSFAVHGVRTVRQARDVAGLSRALNGVFSPLGPGLEIGTSLSAPPPAPAADQPLIAWRYLGAGLDPADAGAYGAKRTHRPRIVKGGSDSVGSVTQMVHAEALRGKMIRLRGQVRANSQDGVGSAALWLRVDRPDRQPGFFDNMSRRPIRDAAWREYTMEGRVDNDATAVAFGALATGRVVADFDAISLSVQGTDGQWTPVKIEDGGFEADGELPLSGWNPAVAPRNLTTARVDKDAPEGRRLLRFSSTETVSEQELFDEAPQGTQRHVDLDLGSGLRARVPLALTDADARRTGPGLDALRTAVATAPAATVETSVDLRLADAVVAWSAFRHFYPYWTEADVDWDARLLPQLEGVSVATTRGAHAAALRRLLADARDGHARVIDNLTREPLAGLPILLGVIEEQVTIVASRLPDTAPVGGVVTSIDNVPAMRRLADGMAQISGTPQWKTFGALQEITTCRAGSTVHVTIETGAERREVDLRCADRTPVTETRPAAIGEVAPGVFYVDLTRATWASLQPRLAELASAAAVIFDVRGYPTDAGARMLPYLLAAAEHDQWMHIAKIDGPFGHSQGWRDEAWNMAPLTPHVVGRVVFLTDGRAISYAESVMGYVADRKLGTIVGSTTAGTNGNVATFTVPGGFTLRMTGMRVTRHDGQSTHHLVGIAPDVPVSRTIAGLRSGRDEVLDRALAIVRQP